MSKPKLTIISLSCDVYNEKIIPNHSSGQYVLLSKDEYNKIARMSNMLVSFLSEILPPRDGRLADLIDNQIHPIE